MTTSIDEKSPQEIEEILKDINKTILGKSNNYKENGYRDVEVGMRSGKKMINVVPKIHVEEAMKKLSLFINETMSRRKNLTKKEYIRQVAKIHYRFIRIHPFPDGNGRTGRALINMMLEPIGEAVVFDKTNKDKYMKALNLQHLDIDNKNKEKYLESLYKNPDYCSKMEENFEYLLEEFIGQKVNIQYDNITKVLSPKEEKEK